MKICRLMAASATFLMLSACMPQAPLKPPFHQLTDPAGVSLQTKIKWDEFKKVTSYEGANASEYNLHFLRAWKPQGKDVQYQIYVTSFYGDAWRFYRDAYDSKGIKLDFTSIDRKVDSCSGARGCYYEETIGLNVTRKYLEENQETGIRYKVSGKAGEFVEFLPAAYVKGFLMSIDKS